MMTAASFYKHYDSQQGHCSPLGMSDREHIDTFARVFTGKTLPTNSNCATSSSIQRCAADSRCVLSQNPSSSITKQRQD